MNPRLDPPPATSGFGVLQKVVASVVGAVFLLGAALVGTLFLIAAFGVAALAATALGLRLWWFRRQLGKTPPNMRHSAHDTQGRPPGGETLEGDYEEIKPDETRDRRG